MTIRVVKRQILLAVGDAKKTPPTEFRVFANGVNETTKGPVVCDPDACAMVMQRYRKRGLDKLPFDAGHGMAYGTDHRSYGWFVPEARSGELWATKIEWNEIALTAFADKQFRFFSPWCLVGYEDGRVKELINIALTNIPATAGLKPLVASQQVPVQLSAEPEKENNDMDPEVLKLLGALGCATIAEVGPKVKGLAEHAATLSTQVTNLTTKVTELTTQNTDLAGKVATLSGATETSKRDALIVTLSSGPEAKLPPTLREWAKTQTFDQLEAYAKHAPVLLAGSAKIEQPAVSAPSAIDTDAQSMLKMFGLAGEVGESRFSEMQAHLSAHQGAFVPSEFTSKFTVPQQGAK